MMAQVAELNTALLNTIIKRILTVTSPDRIILFGSYATGQMNEDSDIDLLIVHDSPGNSGELSVNLYRILGGLGYGFDILVMSTDKFERRKNIIGSMAYPAHHEGKVIYEAE